MQTTKNLVHLFGDLKWDPQIRKFKDGKLARFRLATSELVQNRKGEKVIENQWHNIVAWDEEAEKVERTLRKGARVGIIGRLVNSSFTDKHGIKRYVTDIHLVDLDLLASDEEQ